jgi:hypothetical protein
MSGMELLALEFFAVPVGIALALIAMWVLR